MGKRIVWIGACALIGLLVAFAGMSSARTTPQNTNSGGSSNANGNANSGGHRHGNMNMGGGSAGNTERASSDQRFVMEAAMGGMAEVEMGRMGLERATSDDVRAFSQRLIDDHTRANDELAQIASTKGVTLPTELDAKHRAMMDRLRALSGAAFEREFARMGVKDHREDIKAFQKEADRGGDADIKGFAARTLPTLQEHLRMAESAQSRSKGSMGGSHSNMNMNGNSNRGGNSNNSNNGNRR